MLTEQEATELGCAIDSLIAERGLGAISKKDYELLVFHYLSNSNALRSDGNYTLANKLKVTETRIKSLRLESSIRHSPANHKAVLGRIVQRIIDEMHKPDFSGGVVSITLENPIDRREFEYAVTGDQQRRSIPIRCISLIPRRRGQILRKCASSNSSSRRTLALLHYAGADYECTPVHA